MKSSRERIWFISELFYPVCTSTGYYITEIAKYLAESGLDVGAITTRGKYRSSDAIATLAYERYDGIEIFRVRGRGNTPAGAAIRAMKMMRTSGQIFIEMLFRIKRNDRIVAVTNPPFLIPFLYVLRKLKGVSYTIIVHDLFPENLKIMGIVGSNSVLLKCLSFLFHKFYAWAETVICIGRDVRELVRGNLSGKAPRLVVVTNWADDTAVSVGNKSDCSMIGQLGLSNKLVLQFAGNIGKAQNIEAILSLAKECANPRLSFLFIGSGAKKSLIIEHIDKKTSSNVHYISYMDRTRQNEFLNACDIGIVTLSDGMYGLGVPSKAYNIMAAGKPILYIGDEGSEIFRMVTENDIGWAFRSDQRQEILAVVNSFEVCSEDIKRKGSRARLLAEGEYSKRRVLDRYFRAIVPSAERGKA